MPKDTCETCLRETADRRGGRAWRTMAGDEAEDRRCPDGNTDAVLNVRQSGAKGDGKSDDTKSIQSAIDTAAERGGAVFLPVSMGALNYKCARTYRSPEFRSGITNTMDSAPSSGWQINMPGACSKDNSGCLSPHAG